MSTTATPLKFKVKKGQITFNAEGNDAEKTLYFSRVIHWPGNALSGVTIGRGYDLGNRTKAAVKLGMTKAGVSEDTAKAIAEGAGLKGSKAKDFVKKNKSTIGSITHEQQVKLFDNIYPDYEVRAKTNYDKWTASEKDRVVWSKLHQAIRDVMVDFVYQGFTRGAKPMKAGMNNDFDELIKYVNGSSVMKRYEAGRSRVPYLKNRKPAK